MTKSVAISCVQISALPAKSPQARWQYGMHTNTKVAANPIKDSRPLRISNSGSHDPKLWNVMRDGSAQSADNDNADLRLIDRDNISILPNSYNVDETW
jgi:hypothetical protein